MKLQRDWIQDPQSLPFAQHIKTHALVLLVQKGLQYYEIEQSVNRVANSLLDLMAAESLVECEPLLIQSILRP